MSGWRTVAYRIVRPLLFAFEPERIHRLTIRGLRTAGGNPIGRGLLRLVGGAPRSFRDVDIAGLRFRSRVGIGAGFDKDALALRGWAALGAGFAEVGTVTPLAQEGNPRPRLYRLPADEALVNRMGFNNAGAAALARQVMLARPHLPDGFVVGVNIGRGVGTPPEASIGDYVEAFRLVAPVADYVAVNVSSPNTAGLRDLQDPGRLADLLAALRDAAQGPRQAPPLFVKLAPDLPPAVFDALLDSLVKTADGLILSNTTVVRDRLRSRRRGESGGLSGRALRDGMLAAVARAHEQAPSLPRIASGGIFDPSDVAAAYAAGADLVQLWTGLVYRGPGLIGAASGVPHPADQ
ncbi:MAG TPA: quinone-dependent dihydroorotate dehydrogenase [Candidatus Limnocylindria bacterium]